MEFKRTEIRKYTSERVSKSIWIFNPNKKEANETEKLISCAPEMLGLLIKLSNSIAELTDCREGWEDDYNEIIELIKKATTI